MKTTENISLAGYAFTIETDAYEDLRIYLEEIRNSFSSEAGAEEITSDIEERIAELLSEKCVQGMAVNIDMIRDIKKRIGDPKILAGNENVSEAESWQQAPKEDKKSWKNKRMYRNIDERILGGVCSGLGSYFGIDKVIFRLLFLVFFLTGFADEGLFCIPMVLYICLWIAMPAARTVEQKCEMKGKPIDLAGFRSKDLDINKEVKEIASSPFGTTVRRAGGVFLGLILLICGLTGLLGSIIIPSIPSIIDSRLVFDHWGEIDRLTQFNADILTNTQFWGMVLVVVVLCFIGMIYGGIMLTFDLKAPSWKPGLIIFIAWVISILALAAWVIKTVADALPGIII